MAWVDSKMVETLDQRKPDQSVQVRRGVGAKFFAKDGFNGIVKKQTSFTVAENGAEFVEVIPLQNNDRPVMDLGLNMGYKLGKNTRKQKVVDFDLFNGKKSKQSTRDNKTNFDFFKVY